MKKTLKNKNAAYLLAAVAGTVAVIAITLLVYGTFFQDFLENFDELSPRVQNMIERDDPGLLPIALANFAHGLLITTVVRWGRFYTPARGAVAGAVTAFLTEIYFLFTQYALFKTMTLATAVLDTLMWTLINAVVGALVAWILGRLTGADTGRASTPAPRATAPAAVTTPASNP